MFGADTESHAQQLVRTPYCLRFTVEDLHGHAGVTGRLPGLIRPLLVWHIDHVPEPVRSPVSRISSKPMADCARRWRMTGSSVQPRCRALSTNV